MSLHLKDTSHRSTGRGALAIIDGDIVARACAAAADGRGYVIGAKDAHFKYKKDAKEFCAEHNLPEENINLTYRPDPVHWARNSVDMMLVSMLQELGTDNYKVFISGKGNFRKKIFPEYKAHRVKIRIPEHLAACREHLLTKWDAIESHGCEADDMIATEHMFYQRRFVHGGTGDYASIICTIDKDLDTIPGWHYNWNKGEKYYIKNIDATRNFYTQMITGDTSDGIPGLSEKKPKRRIFASKPLLDMSAWVDMEWYVYCGYVAKYGEESALDEMDMNGKLLWINQKDIKRGLWEVRI